MSRATLIRWRPHTETPKGKGPMTALLAGNDEDQPELYLWGIYVWRDGHWLSEDTLQPFKPSPPVPFWWVPETELLSAVPATEERVA